MIMSLASLIRKTETKIVVIFQNLSHGSSQQMALAC